MSFDGVGNFFSEEKEYMSLGEVEKEENICVLRDSLANCDVSLTQGGNLLQ